MKIVILPVGPRGAGKTTFSKGVTTLYPEVSHVIRDAILLRLFKERTWPDQNLLVRRAAEQSADQVRILLRQSENPVIIFDTWAEDIISRMDIIAWLREDEHVDKVACWYFKTPFDQCAKWLQSKPEMSEDLDNEDMMEAYRVWYNSYHNNAKFLLGEGFDLVREINPLVDKPQLFL